MRRVSVRVLPVITAVLLVAATLGAYGWRVLFGSERFAARATAALQEPSVRGAVAERVTDELVRRNPDLLAARPVVVAAISGAVGSDAFASLFRRGARDLHGGVFRRDEDTVTLTIADVGIVAAEALRALRPELAGELDGRESVALVERDLGRVTGDLARLGRDLRVLTWVLALLTMVAAAAAMALAADRRRAAWQLGLAVVAAGVVIVIAEVVAGALVVDRVGDPGDRAVAAKVWDVYLGDLRTTGWLIAGVGAVLAAAAASLMRPIELREPAQAAWRIVSAEPERRWLRVARGAALVAIGLFVIVQPSSALRIVATIAGVYVLHKGLVAILRVIGGPAEAAAVPRFRVRRIAVPVVATLLVSGVTVAYATRGGLDEPAPTIATCDGHAELCDRPLDEVTLPATHNSMSVPLPGWFASLHERPIAEQLDDGIRALLIDTHYADLLPNRRTRTHFGGAEEMQRAIQQDGISRRGVKAALRLRERAGFRGSGERGMYLCHTFCEIGSTPLSEVLDDIHDFLVTHPSEVLVVINQDAVTPQDFVGAVEAAGLARYALEPPAHGSAWPTLREMVEQNRRLVVLAENEAGAAPWYQLAYQRLTQETPFTFASTAELTDPAGLDASCRPNRGAADAPLFLVNHWINTDPVPRPGNAEIVNAYDALLRRARTCERVRGRLPNLLAVDFYERGDLFRVVDVLNGI